MYEMGEMFAKYLRKSGRCSGWFIVYDSDCRLVLFDLYRIGRDMASFGVLVFRET